MALTDSLISYWKLDEASGSRADSHGSNTLTDNNTVGSATGKIGTAADFDYASSEYLSCADNDDLSTGDVDFTVSIWVKIEAGAPVYTNIGIIGKSNDDHFEYTLFYNSSSLRLFVQVYSLAGYGGTPKTIDATTIGNLATGTWYHVVFWHDSVNNQLGIAVNGGAADTTSMSTGVYSSSAPFHLGASLPYLGFWNGLIDEVGFWKRVLTSGERTQLYNGGAGLAYPFAAGGTLPSPRVVLQSVPRASFF